MSASWAREQAVLAKDNPVDKARASGKPSLVDFGAKGCIPCDMLAPILEALLRDGDYFLVLADFRSYVDTQDRVDELFNDPEAWIRKAILNTAHMGKFSSDRAVLEYAREIWGVPPLGK